MQSEQKSEARLREFNGPGSQNTVDPLKKREQFAISLRQKKKAQLIQAKRQKLSDSKKKVLRQGDVDFESNQYSSFQCDQILREKAPMVLQFPPLSTQQGPTLTERIQYILNQTQTQKLDLVEQLVLVTEIRLIFSKSEAVKDINQIDSLIVNTQIVQALSQIIRMDDDDQLKVTYLKYNAIWIATNLALCSEENEYVLINEGSGFLSFIERCLVIKEKMPLSFIEQCLWFLGNITADNLPTQELKKAIPNCTEHLLSLAQIVIKSKEIQASTNLIDVIQWITHNLLVNYLKDKRSLTLRELKNCIAVNAIFTVALSSEEKDESKQLGLKCLTELNFIAGKVVKSIDKDQVLKEIVIYAPDILQLIVKNLEKSTNMETVKQSSELIAKFSGMTYSVTNKLLQVGLLEAYSIILQLATTQIDSDTQQLTKDACFTLSNIACEQEHLSTLIISDAFSSLVDLTKRNSAEQMEDAQLNQAMEGVQMVNKQALASNDVYYCIGNVLLNSEHAQLQILDKKFLSSGVVGEDILIQAILQPLSQDKNLVQLKLVLEVVERLLQVDFDMIQINKPFSYGVRMGGLGLRDKLVERSCHPNMEVYDLCNNALLNFDKQIEENEAQSEEVAQQFMI